MEDKGEGTENLTKSVGSPAFSSHDLFTSLQSMEDLKEFLFISVICMSI